MAELEGVRPKHSVCLACGYGLAGIEIKRGVIVCPECGAPAAFELRRPRPLNPVMLRVIGLVVGVVVLALLLFTIAYVG